MAFKKILLSGDAAELESSTAASNIGTSATAGVATTASKRDHVHIIVQDFITTGLILDRTLIAGNISSLTITTNEMATDSVNALHLDQTATYTMTMVVLTPQATTAGTAEGSLYYDSTDDHPYIYQV